MQEFRSGMVVPIRISGDLASKLDKAVRLLRYRSRNEFIREAIEQHIDGTLGARIVEIRYTSVHEAMRMIDAYISRKPGAHFVSDIAEELGLELDVAFKAARMLLEKGSAVVKAG